MKSKSSRLQNLKIWISRQEHAWEYTKYALPQWERKRSIQNRMYLLEPEILICIDLHLPFYLYDLAFSKCLCTYSLNMPVLCFSNPFSIHHYASITQSHRYKYLLIINLHKKIYVSTCFPFLSMPYKLDYALKPQKCKAVMDTWG